MSRPLLLHQAANLLGSVGNATVALVVPWLVLDITGSPAAAGLVAAVWAIPGIFMAPFVGAMVDWMGRRRVSVGSDVLSATSVALFPVAQAVGVLNLGTIMVIAIVGAMFDPAGYTARKALIPDVCRAGGHSMDQVNGLHEGMFAAGWVLGPALGALGIATIGPAGTFWVATVAFLVAAVCVAMIRVTEDVAESRARAGDESERFWASSLRGLSIMRADKPLWVLTLGVAILVMIYLPTEQVLLPVHFKSLDQPGALGLTLTVIAAGAMLGSFAYGWLAARVSRHRMVVGSMISVVLSIVPMAFLPPFPVFVVAGFLLGLGWGPMSPLLNVLVQERVPAHIQGRVYGVQTALFYATPPIGLLLAGLAVEAWGVQVTYAIIGAGLVVMAIALAAMPSLRGLSTPVLDAAAADSTELGRAEAPTGN